MNTLMIFLNLKRSSIPFVLLLFTCLPTKNDTSNRGDYLMRYLKETSIVKNDIKDINIYIIYVDRCKTCRPNRISKIISLLGKYDNNAIIFNGTDSLAIEQLSKFAPIYIDKKKLSTYGLIAPENQFFIVRDNKLIFDSFLDENNYHQIKKAMAVNH